MDSQDKKANSIVHHFYLIADRVSLIKRLALNFSFSIHNDFMILDFIIIKENERERCPVINMKN
jgi:hypothetical protein